MNIIVLSPEELQGLLQQAAERGAGIAIAQAREILRTEEPVTIGEAMRLAGYSDQESFRKWCRVNGIVPEKKARKNYYLPSQLRSARVSKGARP